MRQYTVNKGADNRENKSKPGKGYVVSGAPWSTTSTDDFPTLGGGKAGGEGKGAGGGAGGGAGSVVIAPRKAQWGPSAFGPKLPRSN